MSFQQALSGLNAAAKNLEVLGNNISNASTIGFKGSSALFADIFAGAQGGANQIGIGTSLASVSQNFSQGNITVTNNPLDLAINGLGFFKVSNLAGSVSYTRNSNFSLDKNGNIVSTSGQFLNGYPIVPGSNGVINKATVGPIQISTSQIAPQATQNLSTGAKGVVIAANLNAASTPAVWVPPTVTYPATVPPAAPATTSYNSSTALTVYDSIGAAHSASLYFSKPSNVSNMWNVYTYIDGVAVDPMQTPAGMTSAATAAANNAALTAGATAGQASVIGVAVTAAGATGATATTVQAAVDAELVRQGLSAAGTPSATQIAVDSALASLNAGTLGQGTPPVLLPVPTLGALATPKDLANISLAVAAGAGTPTAPGLGLSATQGASIQNAVTQVVGSPAGLANAAAAAQISPAIVVPNPPALPSAVSTAIATATAAAGATAISVGLAAQGAAVTAGLTNAQAFNIGVSAATTFAVNAAKALPGATGISVGNAANTGANAFATAPGSLGTLTATQLTAIGVNAAVTEAVTLAGAAATPNAIATAVSAATVGLTSPATAAQAAALGVNAAVNAAVTAAVAAPGATPVSVAVVAQNTALAIPAAGAAAPATAANALAIFNATVASNAPTTLYFTAQGAMGTGVTSPGNGFPTATNITKSMSIPGANPLTFDIDFTAMTQFGSAFGVNNLAQTGYAAGQVTGYGVGPDGVITGKYSNGQTQTLGQVLLATCNNIQGLKPIGGNLFVETAASGTMVTNVPGTTNLGSIQAGSVENSNVDMTAQLVDMITAQREYQANAQTIKTEDQLMQTIVNLR